jgi:hypothetical protein
MIALLDFLFMAMILLVVSKDTEKAGVSLNKNSTFL